MSDAKGTKLHLLQSSKLFLFASSKGYPLPHQSLQNPDCLDYSGVYSWHTIPDEQRPDSAEVHAASTHIKRSLAFEGSDPPACPVLTAWRNLARWRFLLRPTVHRGSRGLTLASHTQNCSWGGGWEWTLRGHSITASHPNSCHMKWDEKCFQYTRSYLLPEPTPYPPTPCPPYH